MSVNNNYKIAETILQIVSLPSSYNKYWQHLVYDLPISASIEENENTWCQHACVVESVRRTDHHVHSAPDMNSLQKQKTENSDIYNNVS